MRMIIKSLIITSFLCFFAVSSDAQEATAISSNPGRGLHVALNWSPSENTVKYAIYRKNKLNDAYPESALNTTPIQVLSDCKKINSLLITKTPVILPDSTAWKLVAEGLSDANKLFNPCQLNTITPRSEKYKRLQALAKISMPVAIAAGWGYRDYEVESGTTYYYKIVGLNSANKVVDIIATDLKVIAGVYTELPAPINLNAEGGDDEVLVTWENVPGASGFIVERALSISGPFKRVNESWSTVQVNKQLNGDTIVPSLNGFLDYQRYSIKSGRDSSHVVNGITISGPINDKNYFYRVKAIDLFKRPGKTSTVAGPVIPLDKTPPSVPIDLSATPDNIAGQVNVRWTQVVKNINGHWERPDSSVMYKIYRFTSAENPDSEPSVYLGQVNTIKGVRAREFTDTDPNLRSDFGNTTWWYRLRSVDNAGNISNWSTAVSAIIKDITPPSIPKNILTKGFEDHISVKWDPNTEADMASYVIYRSLCHLGSWVECLEKDTCYTWLDYSPPGSGVEDKEIDRPLSYYNDNNRLPCPCSGPFVFLGEITQDSVEKAMSAGNDFFEDYDIPAGSPLCYAYWIKAKDLSDNMSGSFPIPSLAERNEIQCERLRDLTPPEPALISGLFAQAEQITIEWMGPPTQDTRAYHVYRAKGTDPLTEPATNDYSWVGGMTIELPPELPAVLYSPYHPPAMATCDRISVQATPWMSQGYFEDKTVEPKLTYWYKVVGIDYDGNETELEKAVAISTFTFSRKIPDSPVLDNPVLQTNPCSIELSWTPSFNAGSQLGFIVYKSNKSSGPFTPIVVSPLKSNSFVDRNVVKGQPYWYRVAVLMLNGRLSKMSDAKKITP